MTTPPTVTEAPMRLRDLDAAAFAQRYSCDRLTASILANRFRYVVDHMSTKLRANAFSIVIRDMDDFCTTVQGPPELHWAMPAASHNPVHWGPVSDAVGIVLEEIGLDSLRPGDVVIANDSYRTGKHLNDTSFVRPIFHAGRLVGAVHVTAHQLDLGSRVPGGFDLRSQSLWEDGLVLAPVLLYSEGVPVRSTFNQVAANTRAPEVILADFQVIRATLDLGEQLLLESIERYGIDAYLGAIRFSCDVAAEEMTRALERIPDGDYVGEHVVPEDCQSDEAPSVIRITFRKRGSRCEVDFGGTSAPKSNAMNCSWLDAKTGVVIALMMLFSRKAVPNSGSHRGLDFVLPAGCIVNPAPPTPTMMYFGVVDGVIRATIDALDQALDEDAVALDTPMFGGGGHRAFGRTEEGVPWEIATADGNPVVWPKGATSAGDADGYGQLVWTNMPAISMEVLEMANPMLVLGAEAMPDTAGAGEHRGGAGMELTMQYRHGGTHHHRLAHPDGGAAGAHGGAHGTEHEVLVLGLALDGDASEAPGFPLGHLPASDSPGIPMPAGGEVEGAPGAVFRSVMASGGGWGDPYARDPALVVRDVRDGYVSVAGAARDYGVVIVGDPDDDPEHLAVDPAATAELRASARGRPGA